MSKRYTILDKEHVGISYLMVRNASVPKYNSEVKMPRMAAANHVNGEV